MRVQIVLPIDKPINKCGITLQSCLLPPITHSSHINHNLRNSLLNPLKPDPTLLKRNTKFILPQQFPLYTFTLHAIHEPPSKSIYKPRDNRPHLH